MPGFLLPIYDLINDSPLLGRSFAEINAGGFDAFVAHKISEECDVIATLQGPVKIYAQNYLQARLSEVNRQ